VNGGWLDVTRALRAGHPNWPGDVPLSFSITAQIALGASVNLSAIHTSLHAGTHVDAPWHYDDAGVRLGDVDVARLIGPAWVVRLGAGRGSIDVAEFTRAVAAAELHGPPPARVLLATGEPDDWGTTFPEHFRSVSPELVAHLAAQHVEVIGTDAPSVDALTSKDLPGHTACARHGVLIVEGLALAQAPLGSVEFLCLPLSLPDADASPARALLRRG
jgi:arylformamidase